jgi:hypothetical protein
MSDAILGGLSGLVQPAVSVPVASRDAHSSASGTSRPANSRGAERNAPANPEYLPDLSGLTGGLRQFLRSLRAVAADATGAASGAPHGAPAAPALLATESRLDIDA